MDRRKFIEQGAAVAAGNCFIHPVLSLAASSQGAITPEPERLILSTPLTHSDWMLKDNRPEIVFGIDGVRHMLGVCKAAGISQVYWRVFDAGRALYKSKLVMPGQNWEFDQFWNPVTADEKALLSGYHADYTHRDHSNRTIAEELSALDYTHFDSLAAAIEVGHELGLQIHAWVTVNEDDHGWGAPSAFSREHSEYRWVRRDGRPYRSQLSFAFPEVMEYKLAIIQELLGYDLDGFFIDWLRTGDVRDNPQTDAEGVADHGYEAPLVDGFKRKYGVDPHTIPNSDPRWVKFRAEPQTVFMQGIRKLAKAHHKPLPVAVLVANPWCFRGMGDKIAGDLSGLLINVPVWAQERLIDAASPAGYFRGGGSSSEAYDALERETFGKIEVWPYEWVPTGPAQFVEQAGRARSLGAKHILFWEGDYFDNPAAAERKAIAAAMTAQAVPRELEQESIASAPESIMEN